MKYYIHRILFGLDVMCEHATGHVIYNYFVYIHIKNVTCLVKKEKKQQQRIKEQE